MEAQPWSQHSAPTIIAVDTLARAVSFDSLENVFHDLMVIPLGISSNPCTSESDLTYKQVLADIRKVKMPLIWCRVSRPG
jgi:hypothetical protein